MTECIYADISVLMYESKYESLVYINWCVKRQTERAREKCKINEILQDISLTIHYITLD